MKVLYTYFGLMQRIGGVSRYFYENITRIRRTQEVNVCSLFVSNEYFKTYLKRPWFNPRNQILIYLRIILEECFLWFNLKFTKYNIVHLTAERLSVFRWTKKAIVITIHDMIPEIYCTNSKIIERRKQAIYKSSHIICVSENTKKDLLRIYPDINENKISVIYHGYTPKKWEYSKIVEDKYVLYVGARTKEYKNFDYMVKAIAPLLKENGLKFVCTGQPFNIYEKNIIKEEEIEDYILNVGFVDDETLSSLYHFAECFVYPSSYEGFGIPILEAWEHGCPSCISNASCFPEIGGNAVDYFDPHSLQSIRNSIQGVLNNKDLGNKLKTNGFERLKMFTWDKAAEETIKVYNKIVKNENSSINNLL